MKKTLLVLLHIHSALIILFTIWFLRDETLKDAVFLLINIIVAGFVSNKLFILNELDR